MTMVIYWANENAPNGGTSSKSIQILAVRRNVAKEKNFWKKKFTGAMLFMGPEFRGEKIEKYFFSNFHVFHVYFSYLF